MTLRRKLGGPEIAWGISSGIGSANTLRIARLRGPLKNELLASAFRWLQKKHPLLQVRVENRHGELFFTSEGVGDVPVTWLCVDSDAAFRDLCESELNNPIDWSNGPLLRVTGVEHGQGSGLFSVLIVFHHAINDSTSSTQLVTQMLAVLAVLARGDVLPEPETLPLLPASDRLLPDDFRNVEGLVRVGRFLARNVANELLLRPTLLRLDRKALDADVQRRGDRSGNTRSNRSTHLLFRSLSESSTRAIEDAARAHGTTVQGALCAAMLMAGYRMAHVHLPSVNYRIFSFVNIRGLLEPQVHKESLGCFVSMIGAIHRVAPESDFWELARSAKRELDTAIARGDALANVAVSDRFVDFVSKRDRHTLAAMTVSNIGRLPFLKEHGPFTLVDLQAASAMNGIGACCGAIVSTLHGRLSWTFTYVKPYLDAASASRYFELALAMLCEACETTPEAPQAPEDLISSGVGAGGVRVGARSVPGTPPSEERPSRRDRRTPGPRKEARTPLEPR
ncbi:MAG: hypothetical protein IOD12_09540 [Silvanigrellales bacterium]|nr:hypothetical protein [Silvanigrellales bacterium]